MNTHVPHHRLPLVARYNYKHGQECFPRRLKVVVSTQSLAKAHSSKELVRNLGCSRKQVSSVRVRCKVDCESAYPHTLPAYPTLLLSKHIPATKHSPQSRSRRTACARINSKPQTPNLVEGASARVMRIGGLGRTRGSKGDRTQDINMRQGQGKKDSAAGQ